MGQSTEWEDIPADAEWEDVPIKPVPGLAEKLSKAITPFAEGGSKALGGLPDNAYAAWMSTAKGTPYASELSALAQRRKEARADFPGNYDSAKSVGAFVPAMLPGAGATPTARILANTALGAIGDEKGPLQGTGAISGLAAGVGGEAVGQGISILGQKLLPKAGQFLAWARSRVQDKVAKDALKTAASAQGSAGAAHAAVTKTAENLGDRFAGGGLGAADKASNTVALQDPVVGQYLSDFAAKERAAMGSRIAHSEASDALMQQTAQDAQQALAHGLTKEAAKDLATQGVLSVVKRQWPSIAGATVGGMLGGATGVGLGGLAGRALSPTIHQLRRQVLNNPGTQRLLADQLVRASNYLAGPGGSSPAQLAAALRIYGTTPLTGESP